MVKRQLSVGVSDDEANIIFANWEKFKKYATLINDSRKEGVETLCDVLGERLAMAPASSRVDYHNAFAGGLVEHTLRVVDYFRELVKVFKLNVSVPSVMLASLFHDLGKIGNLEHDVYLPQTSQWHYERGMTYTYNNDRDFQFISTADRSLWLLQHFGIRLTEEEFVAIKIHDGQYTDENKPYAMREPTLALLLHFADRMAVKEEKEMGERYSILE